MDYREPALIGFVQAALDYLNYSKGNGERADLGTLTSSDINFLRDNLGLDFESDAAAILKGHQAFRDIIYTRQNERDAFSRGSYFKDNHHNEEKYNYTPRETYVQHEPENYQNITKTSSEENAKEIDKLFSQIVSGTEETKKEEPIIKEDAGKTITLTSNPDRVNTIKDTITRINNIASKDARLANSEDTDPIFDYVEKENDYYRLIKNISKTYKELPMDFIKEVLTYKEEIDKEYAINIPIVLLHRISFKDVENLRRFTEIMIGHKFFVNVDEEKRIVDVFKQVVNTSGKIITLICEVANQAKFVGGNYEGYRVIKTE